MSLLGLSPTPGKMFWLLSLALLATPFLTFVFTLVRSQIHSARSPLRKLPGPPSRSWLYGNVKQIFGKGQTVVWDEWMLTYGKTFRYSVMFNVRFLSCCFQLGLEFALSRSFRSLPQTLEQ